MSNASPRKTKPFGAMIRPGHGRLTVVAGLCPEGMTFALSGTKHRAGRTDAEILLSEDPHVSPTHATFTYEGGALQVTDEDSLNGVYIRIRAPHALSHGDLFRVGDQLFRFELLQEEEGATDAEGTQYFVSPVRKASFRVLQILEGGAPGLASSTTSDELTLGGEGANVAFTADEHLSTRHARISRSADGSFLLEDTGSVNGTWIRLRKPSPLSHGDYLLLGREVLRVELT